MNEELLNQMWLTYKARFNAHGRLISLNNWYTVIVSSLSVYILCLNILQIMPSLITLHKEFVTFFTISLSIIILVISLIFSFSDNKYRAGKFHDCALEIKELYISQKEELQSNVVSTQRIISKEYASILKKYDLNHHYLDYNKVEVTKDKEKSISLLCFYIKYFFTFYFILLCILVMPIIISLIVIF